MSETLAYSGPDTSSNISQQSAEPSRNLVYGVSGEWESILETMSKADSATSLGTQAEESPLLTPDNWSIPEHQLPGEATEDESYSPEVERFKIELENIDRLLIGSLGALAAVADRGSDRGMANFKAFSKGFRNAKAKLAADAKDKVVNHTERTKARKAAKYPGPSKVEPYKYEAPLIQAKTERQRLAPSNLRTLRLAIDEDIANDVRQAQIKGEHINNGFNQNKIVNASRDKFLAQYFGVTPEELADTDKVSANELQVIRGLLGLPMQDFMILVHQIGTPEGKKAVMERDWSPKKLKPEQAEMLDALERNPDGKIELSEIEPEYREYFDESKIKDLSVKLTRMLEDEAHEKKDNLDRGYELVKDERTGRDKIPDSEWEKIKKEVKTIAIRTYLPTDAPEELLDKVSDALYLLALKEKKIRPKKRR